MHALCFDLNEWRFKLAFHSWNYEASFERHALYSGRCRQAGRKVIKRKMLLEQLKQVYQSSVYEAACWNVSYSKSFAKF